MGASSQRSSNAARLPGVLAPSPGPGPGHAGPKPKAATMHASLLPVQPPHGRLHGRYAPKSAVCHELPQCGVPSPCTWRRQMRGRGRAWRVGDPQDLEARLGQSKVPAACRWNTEGRYDTTPYLNFIVVAPKSCMWTVCVTVCALGGGPFHPPIPLLGGPGAKHFLPSFLHHSLI